MPMHSSFMWLHEPRCSRQVLFHPLGRTSSYPLLVQTIIIACLFYLSASLLHTSKDCALWVGALNLVGRARTRSSQRGPQFLPILFSLFLCPRTLKDR